MFNRFAALIIAISISSLILLSFFWQDVSGLELYSNTPITKADRISQDLGGKWDSYSSLRQAWAQENRAFKEEDKQAISSLIRIDSIVLPSNQGFKVAAKRFQVTGIWGYRTVRLVLEGVYGKTRVFLNGIEEPHYLGEFEGNGGVYSIEISPARLDFSQDNILYLELSPGSIQQTKLFSWLWPEQGRITGQIRLEAVPETTINLAKTTVTYNQANQQIVLSANLRHHQSLEYGPWALSGAIKDKEQIVAECLLPLNSNGEYDQQVNLVFDLPDVKLWSMDNPFLYDLDLVLINNRGDFDRIQMPVGVREYSNSHEKWIINSKEIVVKSEIITQDQDYTIRNQRQIEEYLESIKAKGINVLYFMGFFPNEGWLYSADRLGIGIWLELPVNLVAQGKTPQITALEELILMAGNHPSVMAWTAAKGLEPSPEAEEYLRQTRERLNFLPVYHLLLPGQGAATDSETVSLNSNGFEGQWGKAEYKQDSVHNNVQGAASETEDPNLLWQGERIAAIIWLVWLIYLSIQTLRRSGWNYQELFNPNPKRKVRRALFWSCMGLVSRMITLAAIITSLLFTFPLSPLPWLPYDPSFLLMLKSQNPFLLWLFISSSLTLIRLLQVGLAASSFPRYPGTLDLCCWLERRYGWVVLVGIAWVAVGYGLPWYIPLAGYSSLTILLLPMRIRDVWKIGGKYTHLLFVPITIIAVGGSAILWHREDLFYLVRVVFPQISFTLTQIFS